MICLKYINLRREICNRNETKQHDSKEVYNPLTLTSLQIHWKELEPQEKSFTLYFTTT